MSARGSLLLLLAAWALLGAAPPSGDAETATRAAGGHRPAPAERALDEVTGLARKIEDATGEKPSAKELAKLIAVKQARDIEPPAVAIVVPVAFFAMIAGVVALVLVFRTRREKMRHETIRLALERGGDVPTELLWPRDSRRSDVRRGLVLVCGGAGFALMLAALAPDKQAWAIGVFPLMTGLGYLAYAWLERRGLG